jgi:hypothetical protein
MAAGCVGTARAASHLGFEHAKSRTQFGRAIAYLPLVREKIARMAGTLYTIESVVALTTALAGPSSDGDISVASSVAKVMASEGAWAIADEALQIHGGAGYLEPVGVARLLRDSRITRIFEGTSEVLRLHLGLEMVIGAAPGALRLADFAHPRLADFAGRLDTLLDRTRRAAGEVRGRPGPRLSRRQLELAGVADATMACFAMIASLLRATATLRAAPEGAEAASALSTLRWIEETMACRVEDGLARAAGETGEDLIDALTDTVIAEG